MVAEELWTEVVREARRMAIEPAALAAIVEVESAGQLFAIVDGRPEPLIRFEGHWFDRRLTGDARIAARKAGLANPTAGKVKNPASQARRWDMLRRAEEIDRRAALESVSWGIGQVMGGNWKILGFGSVDDLVEEARAGAAGQLRLMTRFLQAAGLSEAIARHDWAKVARSYNGAGFRSNNYDRRIAAAYDRYAARNAGPESPPGAILARGARGEAVAALQGRLSALGYPVAIDGQFGPATDKAVRAFQRDHEKTADGIVGPATLDALDKALAIGPLSSLWRALTRLLAGILGTV